MRFYHQATTVRLHAADLRITIWVSQVVFVTERDSSRRWKVKVWELNEHTAARNVAAFVPFRRKKNKPRTFEQTKPIPAARVQQHREAISNLLLEVRNIYCIFKGASVCQLYAAVFTVVPTVTQSRCETVDQLVQHTHTQQHKKAIGAFSFAVSVFLRRRFTNISLKSFCESRTAVRAQIITATMVKTTTIITQRLWKLERKKESLQPNCTNDHLLLFCY